MLHRWTEQEDSRNEGKRAPDGHECDLRCRKVAAGEHELEYDTQVRTTGNDQQRCKQEFEWTTRTCHEDAIVGATDRHGAP